jgi:hypothetical protein
MDIEDLNGAFFFSQISDESMSFHSSRGESLINEKGARKMKDQS